MVAQADACAIWGEFPQYSEEEAKIFLNYCQGLYDKYNNGEFDPEDVSYYTIPNNFYFKDVSESYKLRHTLITEEELILREMKLKMKLKKRVNRTYQ